MEKSKHNKPQHMAKEENTWRNIQHSTSTSIFQHTYRSEIDIKIVDLNALTIFKIEKDEEMMLKRKSRRDQKSNENFHKIETFSKENKSKIKNFDEVEYCVKLFVLFIKYVKELKQIKDKEEIYNLNFYVQIKQYLLKFFEMKQIDPEEELYHEFNTEITGSQFALYLSKIIYQNYVEFSDFDENFEEKVAILEECNRYKIENKFFQIINNLDKSSLLKKDFILTGIFFPQHIGPDTVHNTMFTKNKEISEISNNLFPDTAYDKYFLRQIATTYTSLNTYKICLETQTKEHIDQGKLKSSLEYIIDNLSIYSTPLPRGICGVTLHDGKVHINTKYYAISKFKIERTACILSTLLHEICHLLLKHFLPDNKNFFKFTQEFFYKDSLQEVTGNEIGDHYDHLLIGNPKYFLIKDSEFLLDKSNWESPTDEFKAKFLALQSQVEDQNKPKFGFEAKSNKATMKSSNGFYKGVCGRRCSLFL